MVAVLKSTYKIGGEKIQAVVMFAEVEVDADTDEDSLEPVIEAMNEVIEAEYGLDSIIDHNWNSNEIFRIADKLAA